jgi:YggT family protein
VGPAFDTITRPFLRPLRRFIQPLGGVDLTPLILLVILQVLLFPVGALRVAAGTL